MTGHAARTLEPPTLSRAALYNHFVVTGRTEHRGQMGSNSA